MEKRLQIDFTEQAYRELEALQKHLDAKSKSEVIRDALGVLNWLTDEVLEKQHLILVEKPEAGVTREVVFHFLERVRSQKDHRSQTPAPPERSTQPMPATSNSHE